MEVNCSIEDLLKRAVEAEAERDANEDDDAEGWPLSYAPLSPSLLSPSLSPSLPATPPPSLPSTPPPSPLSPASSLYSSADFQDPIPLPPRACSPTSSTCFARSDTTTPPEDASQSSRECPATSASRKHKQAGYYARRKRKREASRDQDGTLSRKIRSSQSKRYQDLYAVKSKFNARRLPTSTVAFIGKRLDVIAGDKPLSDYIEEGFKVIQWSGE